MSDINNDSEPMRLKPISGGTIFVFNTFQSGMFSNVIEQINNIYKQENYHLLTEPEFFVVLGPFDNVIRIDVDDFCIVNHISSLQGIRSQQIQCAYSIWKSPHFPEEVNYWKPFFCITQLKVQNHLMLGIGPIIEEAIAELLKDELSKEFHQNNVSGTNSSPMEIELMATLGWDEFFIFMRNSKGYRSMLKSLVERIRGLCVKDLEKYLEKRGYKLKLKDNVDLSKKHLFLSSYTTSGYSFELSQYLEEEFAKLIPPDDSNDKIISKDNHGVKTIFEKIEKENNLPEYFGEDRIRVSARLSIKPGHHEQVQYIIDKVLKDSSTQKSLDDTFFSIGRFDIYAWFGENMSCKEFVIWFELLHFSLGGNLKRTETKFEEFLKKAQIYNTFSIVSCQSYEDNTNVKPPEISTSEGHFFNQLKKFCLGQTIKDGDNIHVRTIFDIFAERPILRENVPHSIVLGLARIFALFDSCLMDRFICESFIDMYPYMKRIREIIDTVRERDGKPGLLEFDIENSSGEKESVVLQESRGHRIIDKALVDVFQEAIQYFYKGFSHRYLSSYPMMDKNEIGIDFSGRLHRILSAVSGMQNLLLEDLDCHLKKGFNVISTYPHVRIYRGSFDISEANVFHLFQPEIFYSTYHEIMHVFYYSKYLKTLRDLLNELLNTTPLMLRHQTIEDMLLLFQEIAGDVFLMKNGFDDQFELYSFWYWLLPIQSQKKVDSHILLRFLLLSAVVDKKSREIIFARSQDPNCFILKDPEFFSDIINQLIKCLKYPEEIEKDIIGKIQAFFKSEGDDIMRKRVEYIFAVILPAFETIYHRVEEELREFSYPGDSNREQNESGFYTDVPLPPQSNEINEKKKRQYSSIKMFRGILSFIHQNKSSLICTEGSILNFSNDDANSDLRLKLFKYRLALINTLQWESLEWKKDVLTQLNKGNFEFQTEVERI